MSHFLTPYRHHSRGSQVRVSVCDATDVQCMALDTVSSEFATCRYHLHVCVATCVCKGQHVCVCAVLCQRTVMVKL